jgi:hypothetical protein
MPAEYILMHTPPVTLPRLLFALLCGLASIALCLWAESL